MKRSLLLTTALVFAGCAMFGKRSPSSKQSEPERPEAEVRSTLREMQSDYENARAEDFLQHFNRRDYTNYDAFQDYIRDFLIHNHQITMDIVVDNVVSGDGAISARAHWNRRFIDENGALKLAEGRCEFIFRQRPSGGLVLVAVHGASPF